MAINTFLKVVQRCKESRKTKHVQDNFMETNLSPFYGYEKKFVEKTLFLNARRLLGEALKFQLFDSRLHAMQEDDETRFLCGYKNLPRYGTTAGLPSTKSLYNEIIVHQLTTSDTLQGLALKYNSSITEIKRLNKLWSNDSMYLRDCLKIPVISSSISLTSRDVGGRSPVARSAKPCLRNSHDSFASIHSDSEILHDCRNNKNDLKVEDRSQSLVEQSDANSSVAIVTNNRPSSSLSSTSRQSDTTFDRSEEAFSDIFQRIDSTLKTTANNVRRIEAQSRPEEQFVFGKTFSFSNSRCNKILVVGVHEPKNAKNLRR
uniref:LysM domain-containing protein n=1 Tax=Romanomermis culicivorax TaxID=13658 RepID=A0A915HMF9_ROMCU